MKGGRTGGGFLSRADTVAPLPFSLDLPMTATSWGFAVEESFFVINDLSGCCSSN